MDSLWTEEEVNELKEGFLPKNRSVAAIKQFCHRKGIKNPGKRNGMIKGLTTMEIVKKKSEERFRKSINRMCGHD